MIRPLRRLVLVTAALLLSDVAARTAPAPPATHPGPQFTAIASPASGASAEPNLATGPDGRVWLSWIEQLSGGARALRAARLENDHWGTPIEVVSGDSLLGISVDVPALLPMGGDRLVALYLWKFPGEGHARDVRLIQSSDGGATWSKPVTANRDRTPTEHGFASLAADSLGPRAFWLDGRNSAVTDKAGKRTVLEEGIADMVVRSAVLTRDGRLTDEREIDPRACDCCPTAAASGPSGALIAYRDRSPGEIRDISVVRVGRDAAATPRTVHADGWKIQGCPVNGPAVSASRDRVAVAWYTAPRDTGRVLAAFSDDGGGTFGAPVRVDEGAPIGRAAIAVLADGGAIVAWLESGDDKVRLLARRIGRSGRPSTVSTVAIPGNGRGSGGIPRMTRSGAHVYLAWTEPGQLSRIRTAVTLAEYSTTR